MARLEGLLDTGVLRRSLLIRTLVVVALAATTAAAIFIGVTLSLTQRQIEQQTQASLAELIESMSSMASIACFTKDATLAKETAESFIKNSNVMKVTITAFDRPLAEAQRKGADRLKNNGRAALQRAIDGPGRQCGLKRQPDLKRHRAALAIAEVDEGLNAIPRLASRQ